ncbi:MAG: flagellar biosynthetic protein FliO [Pirellulales bacterium]
MTHSPGDATSKPSTKRPPWKAVVRKTADNRTCGVQRGQCLEDLFKTSRWLPLHLAFLIALVAALSTSNRAAIAQATGRSPSEITGTDDDHRDTRRKAAPLPVRASTLARRKEETVRPRHGSLGTVVSVLGALGIVLGLFLLLIWLLKRGLLGNTHLLPPEVVESLGRASFAGRQQVHLLRVGHKLVLVSVTAAGVETLTEITDREEVDRLAGLCRQRNVNSSTTAFRQTLRRFSQEAAPAGSAGSAGSAGRAAGGTTLRADRGGTVGRVRHG